MGDSRSRGLSGGTATDTFSHLLAEKPEQGNLLIKLPGQIKIICLSFAWRQCRKEACWPKSAIKQRTWQPVSLADL